MTWCPREWEAGLGLLAKAYDFSVKPFDVYRRGDVGFASGPSSHGINFLDRVLYLNENEEHCEWLHEVAHIVCMPPWEPSPDYAGEFGGIFGWERAMAKDLCRKGLWTKKDYASQQSMQAIYGVGDSPDEWGLTGYAEWESVPKSAQRFLVAYMNKTLRMAKLLDTKNRPTLGPPQWSDAVEARWKATYNFKNGWHFIHENP